MHLELLVEEESAEVALGILLPKVAPGVDVVIHAFQGKPQLLRRISARFAGYARSLPADGRIVVLVDRDSQDCRALKKSILDAARKAGLAKKVLVRIAVEELEAWFLGDIPALAAAYPGVSVRLAQKAAYRDPDKVKGGTAEALGRVLRNAGHHEGGLQKIRAARDIAARMDVEKNRSRSFQVFRDGVRKVCGISTSGAAG